MNNKRKKKRTQTREKSRWWIADRPWDLDLHDFKQILQIFVAARIR
jgi:hypothetical protein